MPRTIVLLSLLLLISPSAFAQTGADLSISISAPQTIEATRGFTWSVEVINNGPLDAKHVVVTGSTEPAGPTNCYPASIDTIYGDSHATLQCVTQALNFAGDVVIHAHVTSSTPDPHPASNDATVTIHSIAGPLLVLSIGAVDIVPGLSSDIGISWYNNSQVPAENVTATVTLPPQLRVLKVSDHCTQSGQTVTCAAGTVPGNATVTVLADDSTNGQVVHIIGDLATTTPQGDTTHNHADHPAQVPRTFFVTDTTDSLANALDQANLNCTDEYPCKVAFRLGTVPEPGYFTLRPKRALAKITGRNISIDGTTQTRLTGDTNPNGPEVFIDGRDNAWEDAIAFDEPCALEVTGLAIGNFTNAAVTVGGEIPIGGTYPCSTFALTRAVHDNYLGVDPSGVRPAPNGRGIVVDDRLFVVIATKISNNVVSANRRSGIWIGRATGESISGNRIGLDIHNQPLGNGASGIYAGPDVYDTDVRGNYVAFNHDFGIAVDRKAIGLNIGPNSIFANLQPGIDVGLDGPTPDGGIPAPVVLGAQYDAATNTTLLTISSHEPPSVIPPTLIMYASDAPHRSGYGDGQYYLGSLSFDSRKGNIRFAAAGDWRGKWVSATVTRNSVYGFLRADAVTPYTEFLDTHSSTSEFSRAVKLE